jgi:hypothetical protein
MEGLTALQAATVPQPPGRMRGPMHIADGQGRRNSLYGLNFASAPRTLSGRIHRAKDDAKGKTAAMPLISRGGIIAGRGKGAGSGDDSVNNSGNGEWI